MAGFDNKLPKVVTACVEALSLVRSLFFEVLKEFCACLARLVLYLLPSLSHISAHPFIGLPSFPLRSYQAVSAFGSAVVPPKAVIKPIAPLFEAKARRVPGCVRDLFARARAPLPPVGYPPSERRRRSFCGQ